MIAVYEFLAADGTGLGCGTALELAHWQEEGVLQPTDKLGAIIGYEKPSKDEKRKLAWAA